MLSPSKKRVLEESASPGTNQTPNPPTRNELWRWCLRADAVAPCYIRDVMVLRGSEKEDSKEQDAFWWLGTVPCRSVKFVGMVVGARAYEKRTMYTVDDGTGVIQCVHPHTSSTQQKPKSKKQGASAPPSQPRTPTQLAEPPKPRYEIGDIIRVTGRVETWHDTRQILVTEIELCRPNDEPDHWIATAKLHKSYYTQPFVIPPLPPPPFPKTPVKIASALSAFATPSTANTVPTPSTAASTSSTRTAIEAGPTRLRHPSRLRSKELIASTFKIYLKNYMDVLSDPSRPFHSSSLSLEDVGSSSVEESPTKRLKRFHHDEAATPRPREKCRRSLRDSEETPRASNRNGKVKVPQSDNSRRPRGFTLSYLRRVPELADMAHRLVEAERKRRAKEARLKQKEAGRSGPGKTAKLPEQPPAEPTNRKTKRLYTWALRELYKEGSIILHEDDAPVWESSDTAGEMHGVWRASKSDHSTLSIDAADSTASTTISNLTGVTAVEGNESPSDSGELSDPPTHEESYLPLTPVMLTEPIVDAIKSMMMRKPVPKPRAVLQQQGSTYRGGGNQVVGPTAEELREYMGKIDARWENVGEYAVADALELLKAQDRVYRVGKGRWELSI